MIRQFEDFSISLDSLFDWNNQKSNFISRKDFEPLKKSISNVAGSFGALPGEHVIW